MTVANENESNGHVHASLCLVLKILKHEGCSTDKFTAQHILNLQFFSRPKNPYLRPLSNQSQWSPNQQPAAAAQTSVSAPKRQPALAARSLRYVSHSMLTSITLY